MLIIIKKYRNKVVFVTIFTKKMELLVLYMTYKKIVKIKEKTLKIVFYGDAIHINVIIQKRLYFIYDKYFS